MITKSHRQEGLSRAYVQAVAAKAGFGFNPRSVDYGFDLSLHHIINRRGRLGESGFTINVQARSSTAAELSDKSVIYDLDAQTYETLRNPNADSMSLLVLLVLPNSEEEWLDVTDEELLLRRAAYWYNLKGEPESTNRRSIRLAIPRSQLFTPEYLQWLARRAVGGKQL